MPSTLAAPAQPLFERLAEFDEALLDRERRAAALERFFSLPSGREKPGRFWRVDFESIVPDASAIHAPNVDSTSAAANDGLIVCELAAAACDHPALLARAFGKTAIGTTKFGALAEAFAGAGTFVYVPADRAFDEPIVIRYHAPEGRAIFPWTVVLAEAGARVTVIERLTGDAGAFLCGATEIVTESNAEVTYAAVQQLAEGGRTIVTRRALPGRDARVAFACADLGSDVAAGDLRVAFDQPGADAKVTALFFPRRAQHLDLVSTVDHNAGEATSETLVKSAARERGQARFLGNIRIARDAQGSDARLRDDALLLSPTAHVDSVPALEIAANDVKAYHGATVGALDAEQIFYMESRGIEASAAERMIALGFFEPAIERFPSESLRGEIRIALAEKLG